MDNLFQEEKKAISEFEKKVYDESISWEDQNEFVNRFVALTNESQ
ncbi:MAG: hypothetical protein ACFHWX_01145 [Bacteroidota bacterium]